MADITLLTAAELKDIARDNDLDFPVHASAVQMLELLSEAGIEATPDKDDIDVQNAPPEAGKEGAGDESGEESPVKKKAPKAPKAPKKTRADGEYTVIVNLKKDGEYYAAGTSIFIEDAAVAEKLIDDGTIE